jgi:thiol:disulfide interchange protein
MYATHMRRNPLSLLLALALLTSVPFATAQTAPLPAAQDVMAHAEAKAAAEHKNILLTFSASWCGPCKMFERFLQDPTIHPIMDKSFVMDRLDVGERPTDTKHADSPGGEALMASLGGKNVGYPFIVMLDPAGKPIVDSLRTGKPDSNVGYPALPIEVDWFMQMLQKAAPSLSPQETATIHAWLTAHGQH